MTVSIVPEEVIWEYVGNLMRMRPENQLSVHPYLGKLPDRIDLSSEFIGIWRRNMRILVARKIVETFQFKSFLCLENDQVIRVTCADQRFWEEVSLKFSYRAVDRLWNSIIRKSPGQDDTVFLVTPADALLLSILDRLNFRKYSFEWLEKNQAPWIVTAMFLAHAHFINPDAIPWITYFQKPEGVPLALREMLIERTALFFLMLAEEIAQFGDPGRGYRTDARETKGKVTFGFRHRSEILRYAADDFFKTAQVKKAVKYWTGEGTLGFDDGRYLEGTIQKSELFRNMEAAETEIRSFQEIISQIQEENQGEGDSHE